MDNQFRSLGELHSNLSQTARLDALERFRNKAFSYLVATDVAGRGLDIMGVDAVINYDAPSSLDTYLHRIGRTARAGAEGRAVTFITDTNHRLLEDIMTTTKQKLTKRVIPEEVIDYYQQQLQLHERHLNLVEKQEKEEAKLEKAEIEAERVVHAIEHEKEIMARPIRTWFQTDAQRKNARKLALVEDQDSIKDTGNQDSQMASIKNRKKHKKDQTMSHGSEIEGTKGIRDRIRSIKHRHRLYEAHGSDAKTASTLANASGFSSGEKRNLKENEEFGFLPDPTKLHKKQKRQMKMQRSASEPTEEKTRVYAGGRKTGQVVIKERDKRSLNSIRRGGRGKHAFKGKRKHKRR